MQVNLPEPCHEDWNKMDAQEKGRFCGSCQKLVIDFTSMSDTEIINYFKEYKGQNTCGHFKKTQVDRKLKEQETPRRKFFLKELAAACFAFFVASTEAKAQGESYFSEEEIEQTKKNQDKKLEIAINGKIKNGNEVLSNTTISIKGTEHKTVSLENGLFSIYIPNEIAQNQEFVILVIEHQDFRPKEIEVKTSPTNQFIEIDLSVNRVALIEALSGRVGSVILDFEEEVTITGIITNEKGEGLYGATIYTKNKNNGTVADLEGNYSLNVSKNDTLVFEYISYKSKEIAVKDIDNVENVQIKLEEDVYILGGTAVIGIEVTKAKRKWYSPRGAWYKIRNLFR